jgi:hypothetical protein
MQLMCFIKHVRRFRSIVESEVTSKALIESKTLESVYNETRIKRKDTFVGIFIWCYEYMAQTKAEWL